MKNCTRCGSETSDPRWHDYKVVCIPCFVVLQTPVPPQDCKCAICGRSEIEFKWEAGWGWICVDAEACKDAQFGVGQRPCGYCKRVMLIAELVSEPDSRYSQAGFRCSDQRACAFVRFPECATGRHDMEEVGKEKPADFVSEDRLHFKKCKNCGEKESLGVWVITHHETESDGGRINRRNTSRYESAT